MHIMGGIRVISPKESVLPQTPVVKLKPIPKKEEIESLGEMPVNVFQRNPTMGIGDIVLRDVHAQLYYEEIEGEMLSLPDVL